MFRAIRNLEEFFVAARSWRIWYADWTREVSRTDVRKCDEVRLRAYFILERYGETAFACGTLAVRFVGARSAPT
jgi:hypothetical protein